MPVTRQVETAHGARSARPREPRRPSVARTVDTAANAYGPEDLRALFTLTVDDLDVVAAARKDETRLGLALLLVWARAARRLVSDPATLPAEVTSFVASQLEVAPEVLAGYGKRPATRTAHVRTVCRHLGLRAFRRTDESQLGGFLQARVAQTGSMAALREAAETWLVREGLLRPADATLDRLIQQARATAERRLFSFVAGQLDVHWRARLDGLCETEEGDSELMLLRSPPRAPSASSLRLECRRLASIRDLVPGTIDWGAITPSRRRQWAGMVRRLYAQALGRYPPDKRQTLLLAFLTVRAEEVTDAIVEMFDAVIGRVLTRTDDELTEARAEQAEAQVDSARVFRLVAEVLLDPGIPEDAVRDAVFRKVPRHDLGMLVERAKVLDRGHVDTFLSLLKDRFPYVRAFAPDVLATLRFEAGRPDDELLRAMETLRTMGDQHRRRVPAGAPAGFIPARLRGAVVRSDGIDRRAWELCLLSEVRAALRAGELTVAGSRRYTPWDAGLYAPHAWRDRRSSWYAEAGVPAEPDAYVDEALEDLHALTLEVAGRLPDNGAARVERGKLVVDAPEPLELAPEAEGARRSLCRLLPLVDLPDLLMEVDRWCGFSGALLHLTARNEPTPRFVAATRPALFAVLVAEATNLGLETMGRAAGIPYGQLMRVHDWCFREETLRAAVATLLDYHRTLPLTACFGPGTSSSSDGMRFGVSASVLHARHLSRAFGVRRGVSVYSHVSDQGSQFWVNVVNCLMREATFVLDGLVHQDSYRIREHYTDTHGYTDLVFGLFELLGFRFAPRLRDLPDQTLYRARRGANYGALAPVLRRSIRPDLIASHWDAMNRLAASLRDGLVTPSIMVAKLQNLRRQNPLQQAIQELGRIAKTRHLLGWVDDDQLRRRVLTGLNRQERLHSMARAIAFARGGRFPDRDYEAQLDRASALSVVINAVVVWNTRYLSAAADFLAARGEPVPEEAWAHVSPLHWDHVNLVGRYDFDGRAIADELRPLRGGNGN